MKDGQYTNSLLHGSTLSKLAVAIAVISHRRSIVPNNFLSLCIYGINDMGLRSHADARCFERNPPLRSYADARCFEYGSLTHTRSLNDMGAMP